MRYAYNKNTHTLHIIGGCCHTNSLNSFMLYETEEEVIREHGRAVSFCKLCDAYRERILIQTQKTNNN